MNLPDAKQNEYNLLLPLHALAKCGPELQKATLNMVEVLFDEESNDNEKHTSYVAIQNILYGE